MKNEQELFILLAYWINNISLLSSIDRASSQVKSYWRTWSFDARCIDLEVKSILRSDEEKELVWCRREEQRKLVDENFSQTFVKNGFYFLWIRVL